MLLMSRGDGGIISAVESVYDSVLVKVDTAAVLYETVLEGLVAVWLPRPAWQALTRAFVR